MKTLVCLHGWGATGAVWQGQLEVFRERAAVATPTLAPWEAAWVVDYLQALNLPDCLLVGWSLGGLLLLEALRSLEHPRPHGLALVGVPARFCQSADHPWGQPPAVVRAMRRALALDPERVRRDFADRCLAPTEAAFQGPAREFFSAPVDAKFLAAGLDALLHLDLRGRLPLLGCPTAIIQGVADEIVPAGQGEYLSRQFPGARLHLLPDAGHLPFLTQARTVNEIIGELLDGPARPR